MTAVVAEDLTLFLDGDPPVCEWLLDGKPCTSPAAWWVYAAGCPCGSDHGAFSCNPCRTGVLGLLAGSASVTCASTGHKMELAWRPV